MARATVILILLVGVLAIGILAGKKDRTKEWKEFKGKHGKKYKDDNDEKKHYEIFSDNLDKIEAHNEAFEAGKKKFKVAVNDLADLTPEERRRMRGLAPPEESKRAVPFNQTKTAKRDLPASIDWRQKGAVTPIKNQSPCGTCWAFAGIAAIESHYFLKTGKVTDLSEQQLADCVYPGEDCDRGGWYFQAWDYLKSTSKGVQNESDYPYVGQGTGCKYDASKAAPGIQVTGYVRIPRGDENALMQALTIGPVSVAIDSSTDGLFDFWTEGVYVPEYWGSSVDHAVLAVGYGTTDDGTDYYIIKNSWGTTRGVDGYWLMGRGNNECNIANYAYYPTLA